MYILSSRLCHGEQLENGFAGCNSRSFQHPHFPESSDYLFSYSDVCGIPGKFQFPKFLTIQAIIEFRLRLANPADDKCHFQVLKTAHQILTPWPCTHSKVCGYLSLLSHPFCFSTLIFHMDMLPRLLLKQMLRSYTLLAYRLSLI